MPAPAPEVRPRRAAPAVRPAEGPPLPASPAGGGGETLGTHSWGWAPRLPAGQTGPESARRGRGGKRRPAPTAAGRARGEARPGPSPPARSCGESFGCPRPVRALPSTRGSLSRRPLGGGARTGPARQRRLTCRRAPCRAPLPSVLPQDVIPSPQFIPLAACKPDAVLLREASPLRRQRPGDPPRQTERGAGARCSAPRRGKRRSRRDKAQALPRSAARTCRGDPL